MYKKLTGFGSRLICTLIVMLFSAVLTTAHADDATNRINSFLDQEQIRQGTILTQDQRNTIVNIALKYSAISSGATVTEDVLTRAMANALFFVQTLPISTASELTANNLRDSLLRQNGAATIALGLVSAPYLATPDYCNGDPLGNDGRQCTFSLHSEKVSADVEIQDTISTVMKPIYSAVGMPIFSKAKSKLNGCYQPSPALPQASVCYNIEYAIGFIYRVKCGGGIFHFNCDAWAEANGAANIQYLATGSDTAGAVVSAGINCGYSCIFGALGRIIRGDDIASYLLSQDKRFFDVRVGPNRNGDSPYVRHGIIAGCVIPQPYQTRFPYIYATNSTGVTYAGTNLNLGTAHQVPSASGISSTFTTPLDGYFPHGLAAPLTTNMYPAPTNVITLTPFANNTAEKIFNNWTYKFTAIRTWDFDAMFSGTEAVYSAGVCPAQIIDKSVLIDGKSGPISGTQFWAYHGSDYSYNSRGLRTVNAIYAFNGEHLPVTQQ